VLSVPVVPKNRYYTVQLIDGNTFNYGYIGSRSTGSDAGAYMVAGPDWIGTTPAGIKKAFRSATQQSIAIYRTQLFNAVDMPNVVKVQAGYKVQPLSAFLKHPTPPASPAIDFPKIDKDLAKTSFFEYLDFALQFSPPGPEEKEIRAKLARLGVGGGKKFDPAALSPEQKAALVEGMREGEAKVKAFVAGGVKNVNGWNIGDWFGHRTFYNGNWLKRAAAATAGLYGNDAVESDLPDDKIPGERGRTGRQQA
jgi:hypothetical protein